MIRPALISMALICLSISGCVSKQATPVAPKRETFLRTSLVPASLYEIAERFLRYQKGFAISLKKPDQGLLISDWVRDTQNFRARYSLQVHRDLQGSILSVYANLQEFREGQWRQLASAGVAESELIQELKAFLASQN